MVEQLVANQLAGVRFSIPALLRFVKKQNFVMYSINEVALRSRIDGVGQNVIAKRLLRLCKTLGICG